MVGVSKWQKFKSSRVLEVAFSLIEDLKILGLGRRFAPGLFHFSTIVWTFGLTVPIQAQAQIQSLIQTKPIASISPVPLRKKPIEQLIHGRQSLMPPATVPVASPSPATSAAPPITEISDAEAKTLLREFEKAQKTETQALEHRQKIEMRELRAAQKARFDEWTHKEDSSRREFFKANRGKGPFLRAYMKDLSERRKTLIAVIEDERISRLREQDARRGAVKEDQANRLREFKTALARKWRPSRALWPTP